MKRRIVLTGAQGFLGRWLAAAWLAAEPDVTIVGIGRSPRRTDAFTHRVRWTNTSVPAPLTDALTTAEQSPRYSYAAVDLASPTSLAGLLHEVRPHVVVHLAGALRDEAPERLFSGNAAATIHLLDAIASTPGERPRVILGSTGAVYGLPATLPIREDAAAAPLDPYAVSKRAAEDAARLVALRHQIPLIIARIFNPIGPGQDERHVGGWIAAQLAAIHAGAREPVLEVGPLHRTRDFIDARDVARALMLLSARGEPDEIYNVATGIETSIESLVAAAIRVAHLEGQVRVERRRDVPAAAGAPRRYDDPPRHVADTGRLRALGFTPAHTLERSLHDLLAWYRGPVARRAAEVWHAPITPSDPHAPITVSVDVRHEYSIIIEPGLRRSLPQRLRALAPSAKMIVLDDTRVHALYGAELVRAMRSADLDAHAITVPDDESSKSLDHARGVIEDLHRLGFDRRSLLVNLGGGLVTDLGGYVASTYLRGVAYVNVPTTLLAQHDSAIGGKVAVNLPWAKNFVGAFHQPRAVFCDPEVLATLAPRDVAAGVAEAIKVALIDEPDLFMLLEARADRVLARDGAALAEIVRRAAAKKVALLAPDPLEHDLRRALNLGHTFGHALEVELGYKDLLHGEAVAFGLAIAAEIARARGLFPRADRDRLYSLLRAYDLPPTVPRSRLDAARKKLAEIRLVRGGRLNYVLPEAVGRVQIVAEVGDDEIGAAIASLAEHPLLGACVGAG